MSTKVELFFGKNLLLGHFTLSREQSINTKFSMVVAYICWSETWWFLLTQFDLTPSKELGSSKTISFSCFQIPSLTLVILRTLFLVESAPNFNKG